MNTSVRKKSTAQRVAVGAASLLTAGALVGVGAQGAFASTGEHGAGGSGTASWSAPAGLGDLGATLGLGRSGGSGATGDLGDLGHGLFSGGQVNGAKAQQLAKRVVADKALFDLLPDALQKDLTALAGASAHERTADAKTIVSSALDGGYGTAIQALAEHLKQTAGDRSAAKSQVGDVKKLLDGLRSGDLAGTGLGAGGAEVAAEVTADAQLSAKLPEALRTDLATLADAPAAEQTADVQKIATTAIGGGYGGDVQQLAAQIAQQLVAGH